MNFLVVDDNRLLCRFLTVYLRGKGHVASSLTNPTKVDGWLELNPCDAIITGYDIGVKMNGPALIRAVRVKHPDLPIVVFTGRGYDDDCMAECRKAGSNGYVSKGLGPAEIYSAVMRCIDQRQTPTGK